MGGEPERVQCMLKRACLQQPAGYMIMRVLYNGTLEAWLYSKLVCRQLTGCKMQALSKVDFYSEEHAASMHDLLKARPRSVAIR